MVRLTVKFLVFLLCASTRVLSQTVALRNSTECLMLLEGNVSIETRTTGIEPNIELWEALLSIAGFGIFASFLAYGFTFIRKMVHNDRVSQ